MRVAELPADADGLDDVLAGPRQRIARVDEILSRVTDRVEQLVMFHGVCLGMYVCSKHYVYICLCFYMSLCVPISTDLFVCLCACMFVCVYACMYVF